MAQNLVQADLNFGSSSKILGLPAPVGGTEAANKDYVDTMVDAAIQLVEGLAWKDEATAAFSTNVNLGSPPASQGATSLPDGSRYLLFGQSSAPENGIWLKQGGILVRAGDADTPAKLANAICTVAGGDLAGSTYRQTQTVVTLGVTAVVWVPFLMGSPPATTVTPGISRLSDDVTGIAGVDTSVVITPAVLKAVILSWAATSIAAGIPRSGQSFTIGDGVAVLFTLTHGLLTTDVLISVSEISTGNIIRAARRVVSTTQVEVSLNVAPATNSLRVQIYPVNW